MRGAAPRAFETAGRGAAGHDAAEFTGLGIAEFVTLCLHEGGATGAATIAQLGVADPAMTAPPTLAYGRSGLLARGLLRTPDARSIEPAGIGRLVAHAAANATSWLTIGLVGGDDPVDALVVVCAPAGAMVVVRRALLSFHVAPADLRAGLVGVVWKMLDRHFDAAPEGAVTLETVHARGGRVERRRALLNRLARVDAHAGDDDEIVPDRFDITIGHDLDDPDEAASGLDDDGLDAVIRAELAIDDSPGPAPSSGTALESGSTPERGSASP